MKNYTYNKASAEGLRMFKLIDAQYNEGSIGVHHAGRAFKSHKTESVMRCRVNDVSFIIPSNSTGIKRPQVMMSADTEIAWGDFPNDIGILDFTHDEQELPMTYAQPLEDETLKVLIDAGLYSDSRFEETFDRVIDGEVFDVEAELETMSIDLEELDGEKIPVVMAEPFSVVREDLEQSDITSIQDLIKRSAQLVIDLKAKEQEMGIVEYDIDPEVFIEEEFEDLFDDIETNQALTANNDRFSAKSELLDREIDVTDELRGVLGIDSSTEEDRIQELKTKAFEDELKALDGFDNLTVEEKRIRLDELEREMARNRDDELPPEPVNITQDDSTVVNLDGEDIKAIDEYEKELEILADDEFEDDGPDF